MTDKPTALRLADDCDEGMVDFAEVAAELRRLSAWNARLTILAKQRDELLEQLSEIVEMIDPGGHDVNFDNARAALAEPTGKPSLQVEPVAKVELMTTGGNAGLATRIVEIDDHLRERLRPGQMLYTHPAPQRQPLTEYEAWEIWDALADRGKKGEDIVHAFARAIERAHGIGGQDEVQS